MSIIRHKLERNRKNTNFAEKQEQELAEIEFAGIYPANYDRASMASISIKLLHWFEKTSRTMYGTINLNRDELIALRNDLNTMIESDQWSDKLENTDNK